MSPRIQGIRAPSWSPTPSKSRQRASLQSITTLSMHSFNSTPFPAIELSLALFMLKLLDEMKKAATADSLAAAACKLSQLVDPCNCTNPMVAAMAASNHLVWSRLQIYFDVYIFYCSPRLRKVCTAPQLDPARPGQAFSKRDSFEAVFCLNSCLFVCSMRYLETD